MSNQSVKPPQTPIKPPPGFEQARWGRRIAALFIDWIVSSLVMIAVAGYHRYSGPSGTPWISLVLFIEIVVFTVLVGGSFGQIVLKIRVRRVDGARLSPWAILIRSLLIMLVIPPVIYKPDGRGLHDMAVNSAAYHLV